MAKSTYYAAMKSINKGDKYSKLKEAKNVNIQEVLKKWLNMVKIKSNVRVDVDINPYSFM